MKTIYLVEKGAKKYSFSTFKKVCKEHGLIYQTLANTGQIPKLGKPVTINNLVITKLDVK